MSGRIGHDGTRTAARNAISGQSGHDRTFCHSEPVANDPIRHRCRKCPDQRNCSALNDVWWKWASRAARADIVALPYCLAMVFREIAQRRDGNVTQLPMVIGVSDYCTPCHGKAIIRFATVRCWDAPRLLQASAASLRSRVNSGHRACALAWPQNPMSVIIAKAGMGIRVKAPSSQPMAATAHDDIYPLQAVKHG
jgi:hypothetical protein